jgi:hypothetical protein
LFALVTGGRDTGSYRFETTHLLEHVRVYLRILRMLAALGFSFRSSLVEFAGLVAVETAVGVAGTTSDEIQSAVRAHWLGGSDLFLQQRGVAGLRIITRCLKLPQPRRCAVSSQKLSSVSTSIASKAWVTAACLHSGSRHSHRMGSDIP